MNQYQEIRRVQSLLVGDTVRDYEHCWARDEDGGLWVRKRELETGVEVIAAEVIGWYLAKWLGVPVPDAAIYHDPQERYSTSFLSRAIQPAHHWDDEKYTFINNIDDLGPTLALDALILNGDRHAGNLLLEPETDELHLHLWSIDFGNAVVGWPGDFLERADEVPVPVPGLVFPVRRVLQPATETAARAATISKSQLAFAVMEAVEITQLSELRSVIDVLKLRCERAPELVSRYLSSMTERST